MAAAAGLAASMAVTGYSHAEERLPDQPLPATAPAQDQPPRRDYHIFEMAPNRPSHKDPRQGVTTPAAKEAELRNQVSQKVLETAVRQLRQPVALQLQVRLDKQGRIARAEVEAPKQQARKIEKAVRRLAFKSEGTLAGEPMALSFTIDEVRTQMDLIKKQSTRRPRTHKNEMCPPRPPSHFNEEAPF